MKLEDAATLFLGSYDNLRTRRNYSETIKPLISWLGPAKDVQQVTAIDLHIYVQYIRDRPARWSDHPIIPEKEGQLAPATVGKHIRVIKRFFNYCIEVDVIMPIMSLHYFVLMAGRILDVVTVEADQLRPISRRDVLHVREISA